MNVKEIIEKHLIDNGYDGLAGDDCGCPVDDLMCCDENVIRCEAGRKTPCDPETCVNDGDCDFHISAIKTTQDTK